MTHEEINKNYDLHALKQRLRIEHYGRLSAQERIKQLEEQVEDLQKEIHEIRYCLTLNSTNNS